jgi:hypothetical protein
VERTGTTFDAGARAASEQALRAASAQTPATPRIAAVKDLDIERIPASNARIEVLARGDAEHGS